MIAVDADEALRFLEAAFPRHYRPEGQTPVPCGLLEWAPWFETAERHVAITIHPAGVLVSTVFLGIDHSMFRLRDMPPVLFETMMFIQSTGYAGNYCVRSCTWESAESDHRRAVGWVELAASRLGVRRTGGRKKRALYQMQMSYWLDDLDEEVDEEAS